MPMDYFGSKFPKIAKRWARTSAENFPRGEGQRKKDQKIAKKAENSNFKPFFTIFVPCLKIQESHAPPADVHGAGAPLPDPGSG